MFGSIYIGMSGLNAYSKGLQTVSNNVSNMNTVGYKANDVTFKNIYGTGSQGGLNYGESYTGSGHGVSVNDLTVNFNQGELRQTGKDLDLSVDGNGFFVLLDGDKTYYTRTGSFSINDDGFIELDGTDYRLGVLDETGRPVALNIDQERTDPPEATTTVKFRENLSSTSTEHNITDIKVFDERGKEYLWSVKFTREETVFDDWKVKVTDSTGKEIGEKQLKFSSGIVDPTTSALVFSDADSGLEVTFDFGTEVTSYSTGSVSGLKTSDVDGHTTGTIATVKVNDDGEIEITYTNEEKQQLGAIALADFRDPQALQQQSRALFTYDGYGQHQYLAATDERVGTILGGRLEASNVDLGAQFGDLILIQRGFQASSQIISVTNDMIQQLFGIRGQG